MPRGNSYVNNASNRSLGRVGAPMGSMPVSRSSSSSGGGGSAYGGGGTYVDNASNRSIGRVGAPMGSMPVSRSSSASGGGGTYVDNASNRSIGRVGAPMGSMPVSRSSSASGSVSASGASSDSSTNQKVHVDNPLNRRLGRVGKPHGACPHTRTKAEERFHVDNAMNRALNRVGLKVGTKPFSKKGTNYRKPTTSSGQLYEYLLQLPDGDDHEDFSADQENEQMCESVFNLIKRMNQVLKWQETNPGKQPQTALQTFQFDGPVIKFEDIDLQHKIGQGGFGDVHFAKLKGTVVAVKKLRVQRVSKSRLTQFQGEVGVLCRLDHPHIVKFIGACIVTPHLAIVLEYMQKSLFEALHVNEIQFSDKAQHKIILHMADGLAYLHDKSVAHCDMKSTNILLDDTKEDQDDLVAKISDFGLSIMKNETETSQSTAKVVQFAGTPKYSALEVLSGEELDMQAMCKADVYSMSLIAWEVICQKEPFYGLNMPQLKRRIEDEKYLKFPDDIKVGGDILALLKECWNKDANKRPSSNAFKDCIKKLESIK